MAKKNNMIPVPTGGSVVPKLIGVTVTIAVLVVVVKHPTDAAIWLKSMLSVGTAVVDGIAAFIQQLAS